MKGKNMTKRALISVSDKVGIVEFVQELKKFGWEIISTCLLYTSDAADE